MTRMPHSLYALREDAFNAVYGPAERELIASLTIPVAAPQTAASLSAHPEILSDVEVLLSGWGGPRLDHELLDHAPRLRAVFYGGGSIAPIMTPAAWRRGLLITCAQMANAVPVAEYAASIIMLSLKQVWHLSRQMRAMRDYPPTPGIDTMDERCIGLVSLGAVGRQVVDRLRTVEAMVLAYDPGVSAAEARTLGVTLVPLRELFEQADVVSVHTPELAESEHLIRGEHLRAMKPGATFLNTARGTVVDEDALATVAVDRPDLQFILDVTRVMPLPPSSPLYALPNVMLTPHIAGSRGSECRRLGRTMVEELQRYIAGEPLRCLVTEESAQRTSHATPRRPPA